ncbi:MAG: hypothetical protein J0L58_10100 [Burkholderiales bacterium]|nr:hypothetical protein [Burkholderiales bacterium]
MNAPSLEQIVEAVLRWQHAHPLAQRLHSSQVQGIGLVALPFARSEEAPPSVGWRRWRDRLPARLRPAPAPPATFSEAFIDGISPASAAHFAQRHGAESVEGAEDWPQRRIEVDSERAALAGGWPYERWLATAALDDRRGIRHRLLIGLQAGAQGPLEVLGSRHLEPKRWGALMALSLALGLAAFMGLRGNGAAPPEVRVSGSVAGASAPLGAASVSAEVALPASAASDAPASTAPASTPASLPLTAAGSLSPSLPSPSAASSQPGQALSRMSEAPFDIRPQIGRQRPDAAPRPPLLRSAPASIGAAAPEAPASPERPAAPAGAESLPGSVAQPNVEGPYQGARQPEQVKPRWATPGQTTLALVSQPFARKEEAEAMLARMREHLTTTLQAGAALDGGVFASPQGHRAAVWPFGSREEAAIVNATMVARGWRTRAVDF